MQICCHAGPPYKTVNPFRGGRALELIAAGRSEELIASEAVVGEGQPTIYHPPWRPAMGRWNWRRVVADGRAEAREHGGEQGGGMGRDEPLSGDLISELRLSSSLPSRDPFGPDRCHLFTAGLLLSRLSCLASSTHDRWEAREVGGWHDRQARGGAQGHRERRRTAQLTRSSWGARR
uniref:Uncharacterized protein n=1 Tax=Oryza glumipatula TaxID=40148 RepID=A0A0E0BFL0_9ORYZ